MHKTSLFGIDTGNTFRYELDDKQVLRCTSGSKFFKPGFFNHTFFVSDIKVPVEKLRKGDLPVTKRTSRMGSIEMNEEDAASLQDAIADANSKEKEETAV